MNLEMLGPEFRSPNYAREKLTPGLVHLGLGHFFRAHPAVYQEELLRKQAGGDFISAINLRSQEPVKALRAQNGLYSVIAQSADKPEDRLVVGGLREVLHWQVDAIRARERLQNAKVVTLTITEKGYCAKAGTSHLERTHEIQQDLLSPNQAQSAIGILAWVCHERMQRQLPGFTALSCDNLQANGELLRSLVLEFVAEAFPQAKQWVENEVRFPSSMVDRIVPHYSEEQLRQKQAGWPIWDSQAVFTEEFKQWVLQDDFYGRRPDWDLVGAQFVSDVKPFEKMKLQLLNASHSWLAYHGLLLGLETVDQAVAHPQLGKELQLMMETELIPALPNLSGFDTKLYCQALLKRFQNPALQHRLLQIAMDGTQKIPQRWWPTWQAQGKNAPLLWRGLAAWALFVEASIKRGGVLQDPKAELISSSLCSVDSAFELWDKLEDIGVLAASHSIIAENENLFRRGLEHLKGSAS